MNIQIIAARENYSSTPTIVKNLIEHGFVPLYPINFFDNVPDKGSPDGIFLYNPTPINSILRTQIKKALLEDLPVYVWERELTIDLLAHKLKKDNCLVNLNQDYGNMFQLVIPRQKIKEAKIIQFG